MPLRRHLAFLAAVGVHVGLLSISVSPPPIDTPEPHPIEVELIELTDLNVLGEGALAMEASRAASELAPTPEPEPEPEPVADEPEPEPEPESKPKPKPKPKQPSPDPTPASSPVEPEPVPTATPPVVVPPEPPAEPHASRGPKPPSEPRPATGDADAAAGRARVQRSGTGTQDHSSYGAEIVRLVNAEIDRDPVAGIRPRDTIEVELRVLPNGRLAKMGDGRLAFANIVRNSLGPVRTRALLRRIKRASARFPRHPRGFGRRHYVVGFRLNFKRDAA
ncbi:MAG: hypothetical protein AAF721_32865 [Myxococcota bacterium]